MGELWTVEEKPPRPPPWEVGVGLAWGRRDLESVCQGVLFLVRRPCSKKLMREKRWKVSAKESYSLIGDRVPKLIEEGI